MANTRHGKNVYAPHVGNFLSKQSSYIGPLCQAVVFIGSITHVTVPSHIELVSDSAVIYIFTTTKW